MKIYDSKYRYSKLDHTEIKRMLYELFEGLKINDLDIFDEISSTVYYFKSNKVEYEIDLERSNYIKSLIYIRVSRTSIRNTLISTVYSIIFIRVKKFKIKLNWYYRDDLWKLWEDNYV